MHALCTCTQRQLKTKVAKRANSTTRRNRMVQSDTDTEGYDTADGGGGENSDDNSGGRSVDSPAQRGGERRHVNDGRRRGEGLMRELGIGNRG